MDKFSQMDKLHGVFRVDEPLDRLCSYRIGGAARYFVDATSVEDVFQTFEFVRRYSIPMILLGNGSNLLFDDEGFDGLILRISSKFGAMDVENGTLIAPAGKKLSSLVRFSQLNHCHALNFLGKIPGNVGGSIANNAGAFGKDIASGLMWVEGFTLRGEFKKIAKSEIDFSYRKCSLRGDFLILNAAFSMLDSALRDRNYDVQNRYRKATQPLKFPSAGCIFKNPESFSAGQLIDRSGCKKMRCGNAEVSDLHANFIINTGAATASSIRELVLRVRERVFEEYGIYLERELQYAEEAILRVA